MATTLLDQMRRFDTGTLLAAACLSAIVAACGGSGAPAVSSTPTADAAPSPAGVSCPARGPFSDSSGYFSQFYEDYILGYVFQGQQTGTYVDVGANDPDKASVTKYFYQRGWRGVNIEPNPDMLALLQKARPEDSNVGVGISDAPGTLTFYRFPTVPGISTFDRAIALDHKQRGFEFQELPIPVTTLNDVLDKNPKVTNGFTFLNVDVEGFEKQVLTGVDLARHPATVILIESTEPDTDIPTYQDWQGILFSSGYLFAMDDGLNRYYVNPSHRGLLSRFVAADYCVRMDKLEKRIRLNSVTPEGR
jgi:FkbM family methyltransferase